MIPTGRIDKDGRELFVGDKIRVPDNPDIVPYDDGIIVKNNGLFDKKFEFVFEGRVGIFPLEYYKNDEIEKL